MSSNNMKVFELSSEEIELVSQIDQLWNLEEDSSQNQPSLETKTPISNVSPAEGYYFVVLHPHFFGKEGWSC